MKLPAEIPKSASQEIWLGGFCQQKLQICQSGNLPGGRICGRNIQIYQPATGRNTQICQSGDLSGGESAGRNTQICQSVDLPGGNLPAEILTSASQEICQGESVAEMTKSACLGESGSSNSQICQSGNLPGESVAEMTKSASQVICMLKSAGRNTQIYQSGNLSGWNLPDKKPKSTSQVICLGEICWQKYPDLPVR